MNPLETLIELLSSQAGPRGSTFAGRIVPQGQRPGLRELMTQIPVAVPDAELAPRTLAPSPDFNEALIRSMMVGQGTLANRVLRQRQR